MFLTVIRTILWILLAGVVSRVSYHLVICNLQTPKAYFHASRHGNTLVFEYGHDHTSNHFAQIRIEYEDEVGQQIVPIIKGYENVKITQEDGKFVIEDFPSNVKSINVIYDLQYDRFAPFILIKEETIFID
ncbi:hypothetical protein [Leptospira kirschneri]|uniref:hypothetical protein n=1 Tax=Leptospira kirschneri TaxID=29507 RepID=UPI0002BD51D2|nr:hypothetical protein [Leptospira kirschneri]EMN26359.1 hypothetical protein LEP1GSC065_0618 [Leptospira kirschneri serovar Sokoine str. RM1]KON78827.1 Uncharacterized protein NV38_0000489 [Leptospira kirschneri serovar Mozdok]NDK05821.1 hypothetical protein [Leptospira kirschneri serovar Mozdok]